MDVPAAVRRALAGEATQFRFGSCGDIVLDVPHTNVAVDRICERWLMRPPRIRLVGEP